MYVGDICVKQFMDIDAKNLFAGFKKIRENPKSQPNRDLIEYAFRRGYLYSEKEYKFLKDIEKIATLSEKQIKWLCFINRRIANKIVVTKPSSGSH